MPPTTYAWRVVEIDSTLHGDRVTLQRVTWHRSDDGEPAQAGSIGAYFDLTEDKITIPVGEVHGFALRDQFLMTFEHIGSPRQPLEDLAP